MSGGVGVCSDISLPKDEHFPQDKNQTKFPNNKKPQHQNRRFFTFRQLNALAVVIVFSSSGMVSVEDFAFVIFSLIYMYFISKIAFPPISPQTEPPVFSENNKFLTLYVTVGAIVGLFLPIAYIFEGIYEGDKEGIKAAAPHVFLLASQVFMEGLAFTDRFSLPIRVFVPVFYNSRRIFTIMEWLTSEISQVDQEYGGNVMGRALAVANMVFWCFNLFGFLLPVYLPKAFKIYYSARKLKD
ncbi:uncharacterized protein [Nicotiana sylvestris]|uniref:Uncharacterized protein LOC104233421 n=1 Tax=Nicotiana sylvestris TaxID=4096 RepID=A0A1U7XDT6_NICSY|nr:PREDICTED: uncharacterized protein LOC104233421 [Nicotiana sylvestris]